MDGDIQFIDKPLIWGSISFDLTALVILNLVLDCNKLPQTHHLPVLRDAGARLLLTQDWALSLWEKVAACAPDFDLDDIYGRLDGREKEFWGRYKIVEAPPAEHQEEELRDICANVESRCREKQGGACMYALRQSGDKGDVDHDLLKAVMASLPRE